jgi:hypothetical protein
MRDEVLHAYNNKHYVEVHSAWNHIDSMYGYIEAVGPSLVLIRRFLDFLEYGWSVARIEDITGVSRDTGDAFADHVLRCEGLYSCHHSVPEVDVSCMAAAIEDVGRQYGQVCLYDVRAAEEGHLLLGRYEDIIADEVRILPYSVDAWLDKEPYAVVLRDVVMMEFETPYMRTLYKYVRFREDE